MSKFAAAFAAQQAEEKRVEARRVADFLQDLMRDQRQVKRYEVYEPAEIQLRRDREAAAILNIAENGAFVGRMHKLKPEIGDCLSIRLRDGIYLYGTVAWIGKEGLGIRFVTALSTIDDILHLENRGRAAYHGTVK